MEIAARLMAAHSALLSPEVNVKTVDFCE